MMSCNAVRAIIVLLWQLSTVSCGGEFKGKVSGFGYEIQALPGGGAISVKPPETKIEDNSGGKVDFAKTEAVPLIPPTITQTFETVASLNPKLDVKGQYTKWTPKVRVIKPNKKIRLVKMHAPKLLPMRRIVAQRRGKLNARRHSQHGNGIRGMNWPGLTNSLAKKRLASTRTKTLSLPGYGRTHALSQWKASHVESYQLLPYYYRHNYGRTINKRDISNEDDFKKSIEALISDSFKKSEVEGNEQTSKEKESYTDSTSTQPWAKSKESFRGGSSMVKYVDEMKGKVNNVVAEAKNVLQNTGKIVHGLKKVINGAKLLTEFTNNAVKFAKFFALEPSNATVDFFEEKAVIAVLESQKAAADAKIAAVVAREAAKKAKLMAKRIRGKSKSLDRKLTKAVKYAERQANKAEQEARVSLSKVQDARKDAIIADRALRKMMKIASDGKEKERESEADENFEAGKNKEQENENEGSGHSEVEGETEKSISNDTEVQRREKVNSTDDAGVGENKNYTDVESISTKTESNETKLQEEDGGNETESFEPTKNDEDKINQTITELRNETWTTKSNTSSERLEGREQKDNLTADFWPKASKNETERPNDSELLAQFGVEENQNEVVAKDFETAGYSLPKEAVNGSGAKEMAETLIKIAKGRKVKSRESQKFGKENANEKSNFEDFGNSSISISTTAEQKSVKPKEKFEVLEKEVRKVNKGPLDLVVTVIRRKLDHAKKKFASRPAKKTKGKKIDIASYDPFNFKSLEAAESSKKSSHYIVDKEDQGRLGISPENMYNSVRSSIPNYNTPKTYVSRQYEPLRSQKSKSYPEFYLNTRNDYTSATKTQRSSVPYGPIRRYDYGNIFPAYYFV